jgi:hypothetical protein
MPIVINELHTDVVTDPGAPDDRADAVAPPADGARAEAVLDLLDLARERELRLACD